MQQKVIRNSEQCRSKDKPKREKTIMKDKEKAAEEEKKETKPEENGVKLTDEQLEQVTGGAIALDSSIAVSIAVSEVQFS